VSAVRLRLFKTRCAWPFPVWATAVVAVWLGLAGVATWLSARSHAEPPLCPLRWATGLPCPFCGTGRAGVCLLEGRPLDAWRFNPLACTCALAAVVLLFARVVFRRGLRIERTPREGRILWLAALALLLLNWFYVIAYVG